MCQGACQVSIVFTIRATHADLHRSFTAQFEHLATTAFARPELDVPEQQLALAYTVDYDLDNFAAAVGFARQAVFTLAHESGESHPGVCIDSRLTVSDIEVDVGDSSLEVGVYEPVQRILDQVRAAKVPSGYVARRFLHAISDTAGNLSSRCKRSWRRLRRYYPSSLPRLAICPTRSLALSISQFRYVDFPLVQNRRLTVYS